MPKHVMHYDFKDFERFVREDLTRQGYALATGQRVEITDLSEITDFDDLAQLMEQTIMTVQVVPSSQPQVAYVPAPAPVPATTPAPVVAQEQPQPKKVSPLAGKSGHPTKHGFYSTKVERTPEEEQARLEFLRQRNREGREREKARKVAASASAGSEVKLESSQSSQVIPADKVVIVPVKEVVAPTTNPFPGFGTGTSTGSGIVQQFLTPGGRSFTSISGSGK
jgi:hypothetical protein